MLFYNSKRLFVGSEKAFYTLEGLVPSAIPPFEKGMGIVMLEGAINPSGGVTIGHRDGGIFCTSLQIAEEFARVSTPRMQKSQKPEIIFHRKALEDALQKMQWHEDAYGHYRRLERAPIWDSVKARLRTGDFSFIAK